jgi:hypothetical protein
LRSWTPCLPVGCGGRVVKEEGTLVSVYRKEVEPVKMRWSYFLL